MVQVSLFSNEKVEKHGQFGNINIVMILKKFITKEIADEHQLDEDTKTNL